MIAPIIFMIANVLMFYKTQDINYISLNNFLIAILLLWRKPLISTLLLTVAFLFSAYFLPIEMYILFILAFANIVYENARRN